MDPATRNNAISLINTDDYETTTTTDATSTDVSTLQPTSSSTDDGNVICLRDGSNCVSLDTSSVLTTATGQASTTTKASHLASTSTIDSDGRKHSTTAQDNSLDPEADNQTAHSITASETSQQASAEPHDPVLTTDSTSCDCATQGSPCTTYETTVVVTSKGAVTTEDVTIIVTTDNSGFLTTSTVCDATASVTHDSKSPESTGVQAKLYAPSQTSSIVVTDAETSFASIDTRSQATTVAHASHTTDEEHSQSTLASVQNSAVSDFVVTSTYAGSASSLASKSVIFILTHFVAILLF